MLVLNLTKLFLGPPKTLDPLEINHKTNGRAPSAKATKSGVPRKKLHKTRIPFI